MPAKSWSYQRAGVDISANDALVKRIAKLLSHSQHASIIDNPGGFAGLFQVGRFLKGMRDPVLVGCADGVGSKAQLAARAGKLDDIGIDLVAMNVNDLVCCGATPLFFLDYVGVHRSDPKQVSRLVTGIARACKEAGCALLGGETAEMPTVYRSGDLDLAGFAVGLVERKKLIRGDRIRPGDVLVGLPSSGAHSNGYTLIQKVLLKRGAASLKESVPGTRASLQSVLLKPTRIYVKPVLSVLKIHPTAVTGIAHITGGGLPGNLVRVLPANCHAVVDKRSWHRPALFKLLRDAGVTEEEMYRVFNMGIGMVLVVRPRSLQTILTKLNKHRLAARLIGTIHPGPRSVTLTQ